MDGTRMGSRSSTRHGPAAVFSGPVRRWKKTWAPITSSANHPTPVSSSRVLLYRWVPLSPAGTKEDASEEPAARPARYLPVSVVLARKREVAKQAAEEVEAEAQTTGSDPQSPATEKDESGGANAGDFEDEKESDDKHEGPVDIEASQEQTTEVVEKTSPPMEEEKQEDASLLDTPMQDEIRSQT